MRVLGLDAGRDVGWSVLDVDHNGRRVWWCADGVLRRHARVPDLLAILLEEPELELVAVEVPEGYAYKGRAAAVPYLLEAQRIGGELQGVAGARGLATVSMPATRWRRALCGKASASDDEVRRMLRVRVLALPTRTSVHARDAAGTALVAALDALRGTPKMPSEPEGSTGARRRRDAPKSGFAKRFAKGGGER
jgi:Holliday junction resolvasome RuvABC endonuclease subunit